MVASDLVAKLIDRELRRGRRYAEMTSKLIVDGADYESIGTVEGSAARHEGRAAALEDGRPVIFAAWQIPEPWRPAGDQYQLYTVSDGGQIRLDERGTS